MRTVIRYIGLFLNFLTPYLGTFIFFGNAIDYFRFIFSTGMIVFLATFEFAFIGDDTVVADLIFMLGAIFVISLFVHSVHMSIKYEKKFDFYWLAFIGRIVISAIPHIVATMILGEMGWLG